MKLPLLGLMMLLPSVYLVQVFNFHLEAVNVSLSHATIVTTERNRRNEEWQMDGQID